MTVVFNLDGTLTDSRHRDHLAKAKRWDEYHVACADDPPNAPICEIYEALTLTGCALEIWTGRSESQRTATQEWFATHLPAAYELPILQMRPDGDHRAAEVLKGDWLRAFEKLHGCLPDLAIDDRATQVAWWRSKGVPCLDCAGAGF